jgi:hypothetical protein
VFDRAAVAFAAECEIAEARLPSARHRRKGNVNVTPSPGVLRAAIVPPCASTTPRAIPSPEPAWFAFAASQ